MWRPGVCIISLDSTVVLDVVLLRPDNELYEAKNNMILWKLTT